MNTLLLAFPLLLILQSYNGVIGGKPLVCRSAILHEQCILYCVVMLRKPDGYCDKDHHCNCVGRPGDWGADYTSKKLQENLCMNPSSQGNCVFFCQAIKDKADGYCDGFPRQVNLFETCGTIFRKWYGPNMLPQ
ncbi:hypothetical protein Trydic_g2128 [Trypoxylus dichotomus]